MRRLPLDASDVTAFGSSGVVASPHARLGAVDGAAVDVLTYEAGAVLGRHETRLWQSFAVLSGQGWASGGDGERIEVSSGQAVLWEPGEEHESGTDQGTVALVVQAPVPPLPDFA